MQDSKVHVPTGRKHTYIVEHLDPELGSWSALEYICIAQESATTLNDFLLTSVPVPLQAELKGKSDYKGIQICTESIEDLFADRQSTICLLDPAAKHELSPEDGDAFAVFLFGGILGRI